MTVSYRRRCVLAAVILVSTLVLWACGVFDFAEPSASQSVYEQARVAIREQNFEAAQRLLRDRHFDENAQPKVLAEMSEAFCSAGYFSASETCLNTAIRLAGTNSTEYHLRLATQKFVTGRYWEAQQNWNYLLTFGGLDLISFPALGNREIRFGYEDVAMERGLENGVSDLLVYFGLGHRAFQEKEFTQCKALLAKALELDPGFIDAQLLWGEMLYEQGLIGELSAWMTKMPEANRKRPIYWVLVGRLHLHQGLVGEASGCFRKAFQLDPMNYIAVEQLARCQQRLELPKHVPALLARARRLKDYEETCRRIHGTTKLIEADIRRAEQCCDLLGTYREALGWNQILRSVFGESREASQRAANYNLRTGKPQTRSNPEFDMRAELSVPDALLPAVPFLVGSEGGNRGVKIRFEDRAASSGINFSYESGSDSASDRTLLFEFTGGGVAALDFDRDGWPDLFFNQGGKMPHKTAPVRSTGNSDATDKLFRNCGIDDWQEVSINAGLADGSYGQGAAVGDLNADGWPDLYVANVGENVLWLNNGDGTFSNLHSVEFSRSAGWTVSSVLADFDGDSLLDVYDVNYATLSLIKTEMCQSGDASVPCDSETQLNAGQDQLLVSRGDGEFDNVTDSCGINRPGGLGLGAVAACFDQDSRLDLFIANDARPNFLFVNNSAERVAFSEEALARGLAFSGTGRAQACMGVAAGDLSGDGLLDLFVTNFYKDYNTLYTQVPGELFCDETNVSGLHEVSHRKLGFGTQAFDADLDGDLDLIVANGDVVDFSDSNADRRFRQSPQFLLNDGHGRFVDVDGGTLGDYFLGKYLGRGLALLDCDRNGLQDIVVSHIGAPAALVVNLTDEPGHFVAFSLVGVSSCRDAIGSRVNLETRRRDFSQQLTAGDGYMASNERQLIFGLGDNPSIEAVSVTWPAGTTERFEVAECNSWYVLVEGSGIAWKCPQY
jgi:tetratricopeptide (TPR) repeat protein